MSRNRILFAPTKNTDLVFDELYYEISHDWQCKAAALQTRRWRALKREMHEE